MKLEYQEPKKWNLDDILLCCFPLYSIHCFTLIRKWTFTWKLRFYSNNFRWKLLGPFTEPVELMNPDFWAQIVYIQTKLGLWIFHYIIDTLTCSIVLWKLCHRTKICPPHGPWCPEWTKWTKMNIFPNMLELIKNHLESVYIDFKSCPAKFGTFGTFRTGVIGCIQKWPD